MFVPQCPVCPWLKRLVAVFKAIQIQRKEIPNCCHDALGILLGQQMSAGGEFLVGLGIHLVGRRDVEDGRPLDRLGMVHDHAGDDAGPPIVTCLDLIVRHLALRIVDLIGAAVRLARIAVAPEFGQHDGVPADERRGDLVPDDMRFGMAVQQQERRSAAADQCVDRCPFGLDEALVKLRKEELVGGGARPWRVVDSDRPHLGLRHPFERQHQAGRAGPNEQTPGEWPAGGIRNAHSRLRSRLRFRTVPFRRIGYTEAKLFRNRTNGVWPIVALYLS
jgi:hypothetical protein